QAGNGPRTTGEPGMSGTSELQEATKEFLIEGHENLDQLDIDLVGLEKSAAPAEALGRIFRTLHTIKGSCSFLGFPHLETLAHAGEDLLGKLRDGKRDLTPDVTDALLHMVDAIRRLLGTIESTGADGETDEKDLIALLRRLANDQTLAGTPMGGLGQLQAVPKASSDFSLAPEIAS